MHANVDLRRFSNFSKITKRINSLGSVIALTDSLFFCIYRSKEVRADAMKRMFLAFRYNFLLSRMYAH